MSKEILVVAGHVCMDVHSFFDKVPGKGQLEVVTRPLEFATGGVVANTGLAAWKLGVPVRLMGKTGCDPLGGILRAILAEFMSCQPDETGVSTSPGLVTSYSLVLNRSGDRSFIHCPGANDVFGPEDIDYDFLREEARLFHFGYPTLMARMYRDDGKELVAMMRRVKECDVLTSLDMAMVNSDSPAGQADWEKILGEVLGYVDIFVPSISEMTTLIPSFHPYGQTDYASMSWIANVLLDWGAKAVMLKLGKVGLYLKTSPEFSGLGGWSEWRDCELISIPFQQSVLAGTTGTGDTAMAGFLAALCCGFSPEECLRFANAVSSCCVERPDAVSGILSWEDTKKRVSNGWSLLPIELESLWVKTGVGGVYSGPFDRRR